MHKKNNYKLTRLTYLIIHMTLSYMYFSNISIVNFLNITVVVYCDIVLPLISTWVHFLTFYHDIIIWKDNTFNNRDPCLFKLNLLENLRLENSRFYPFKKKKKKTTFRKLHFQFCIMKHFSSCARHLYLETLVLFQIILCNICTLNCLKMTLPLLFYWR